MCFSAKCVKAIFGDPQGRAAIDLRIVLSIIMSSPFLQNVPSSKASYFPPNRLPILPLEEVNFPSMSQQFSRNTVVTIGPYPSYYLSPPHQFLHQGIVSTYPLGPFQQGVIPYSESAMHVPQYQYSCMSVLLISFLLQLNISLYEIT